MATICISAVSLDLITIRSSDSEKFLEKKTKKTKKTKKGLLECWRTYRPYLHCQMVKNHSLCSEVFHIGYNLLVTFRIVEAHQGA